MAYHPKWLAAANPQSPVRVLGIDLGTTNSVLSEIVWNPEDGVERLPVCRCLPVKQPAAEGEISSVLVPSVVALLPNGSHWVGEGAKRLRTRPQTMPFATEKNLFCDTKNDIGLRKTYYRAPEEYNHAAKIARHILEFMKDSAYTRGQIDASCVAIGVPASFQLNQRRDTLLAADAAGFDLGDHQLIDEPIATLLDYLFTHPEADIVSSAETRRGVVFDFGGGTCDVAVVEVQRNPHTQQFDIGSRAVSRYHRLGGGDLDAAIVHEVLLPALYRENRLDPRDLSWAEKKRVLEPQLLGTAEALKIALCEEIDRLVQQERYPFVDKANVVARQPAIVCHLGAQKLLLSRPVLDAATWEETLSPFLSLDTLYAQESEFRLTQSLFAPLMDALHRAQMERDEVEFCLLSGGSSLLPQVRDAITGFFSNARVCAFSDPLAMQTAVARGAAWHAFYLAVTGQPLVRPILHDGIALRTADGTLSTLIPAGSAIPYPSDGSFLRLAHFAVPDVHVPRLKIEIVAEKTQQPLLQAVWNLPNDVESGEGITVEYRFSGRQDFSCRAYLTEQPDALFERTIENPLCNVVNPHQTRVLIEEEEEALRQKGGGAAEDRDQFVEIARLYAEIGQFEKATDFLRRILHLINRPDAEILNMQGLYYGALKDFKRQERAFIEADKTDPKWAGPLFNLANAYRAQQRHEEALEAATRAQEKDPASAPYYVLRGLCLQTTGREEEAQAEFEFALRVFDTPAGQQDWELGWCQICAEQLGDEALRYQIMKERQRRAARVMQGGGEALMAPLLRPNHPPSEDSFSF